MMAVGGLILRALIHDLIPSKHRGTGRFISKGGLNCEFMCSIIPPGCVTPPACRGAELTVNLCTLGGCIQTKYWVLREK